MPTCCDCKENLGKGKFAKSQRKKPSDKRRCLDCAVMTGNEGQSCGICLCDDRTKDNPIVRDCACRGTAGYIHLQCLVDLAHSRANTMSDEMASSRKIGNIGSTLGGETMNPYEDCNTCKQSFAPGSRSRMALAMAVHQRYPHFPELTMKNSREEAVKLHVEAFWHKLGLQAVAAAKSCAGEHESSKEFMEKYVAAIRSEHNAARNMHLDVESSKMNKMPPASDLAYALCNLSIAYERCGDVDSVPALLDEAMQCIERIDDNVAMKAGCSARVLSLRSRHVANVHENNDAALEYALEAIDIMRECNPDSLTLSDELWHAAIYRFELGDTKRGSQEAQESLKIREKICGRNDDIFMSRTSHLEMGISANTAIASGRLLLEDAYGNIVPATAKLGERVDIFSFVRSHMAYNVKKSNGQKAAIDMRTIRLDEGTHVVLQVPPTSGNMNISGQCGTVVQYMQDYLAYEIDLNRMAHTAAIYASTKQCIATKPTVECGCLSSS